MTIGWLDPSIDSKNAGDQIISEAVERELQKISKAAGICRLPTQRRWTIGEREIAKDCSVFFVGGTNLLSSHPVKYRQWMYGLQDARILHRRCVLFGVGWWQYQRPPDAVARRMLGYTLKADVVHGARDRYTVAHLSSAGIRAESIACPTLWDIPLCGKSRQGFSARILATVTDYMRDRERDTAMLRVLRERSTSLLIWPQGSSDQKYVRSLGFGGNLIAPGLAAFDVALADPDVEYVGTRLHAAIRALSQGVPSVVIAVDNRAAEMAKEIGFWCVDRMKTSNLHCYLDSLDGWGLQLPERAIAAWKQQAEGLISADRPW